MKTLVAFLTTLALLSPLRAQEPGADAPLPGQEPRNQLEKPVSLIPETAPQIGKPKGGKSELTPEEKLASSKTLQSEAQLKLRIRLRQVKTLALKDPVVQEDWAQAGAAATDPERRQALHDYYEHLYARILKIDNSLADLVKTRKNAALDRLTQNRLDPPTAIAPTPAPAGSLDAEQ